MFRFFTPILIFQIFCLYHAYKNRKDYFWYLMILMLPVIGALLYIFTQVFNKKDLEKISEEIVTAIVPSKKVKDAEKQLAFADTFQNRVALADAHFENADYENASIHYEAALKGNFQKDFYVIKQMMGAMNQSQNYTEVIRLAEKIKDNYEFEKSNAQFIYGLALDKLGRIEEAEKNLKPIDQRYSNYQERLVLAEFYVRNGKREEAKEILDEIITESEHMTKLNKKTHRQVIANVRKYRAEL
ncbi:tetratricopeptide repeat protein [Kordia jejudonensis]|uniref:tetratricopeptide repeat protein n=1 Tax=Kordia jejudonensis TaxID=1348245 RepID=UPI0006290223|nr:tetratricopeptide repeat protein [Kordia jejudonensis]